MELEIKNGHNIVCCNQKAWLEKYIDFNTEKEDKRKMNVRRIFLD